MKKQIKFRPHLIPRILSGEKRSTWRLFDDKDLQVGDELEFLDWETKEKFGEAKITSVRELTLGALDPEDLKGTIHENHSQEELYEHYRQYYGEQVGADTPLKIVTYDLRPA